MASDRVIIAPYIGGAVPGKLHKLAQPALANMLADEPVCDDDVVG